MRELILLLYLLIEETKGDVLYHGLSHTFWVKCGAKVELQVRMCEHHTATVAVTGIPVSVADPVHFYPKDPGAGMIFFRIPDPYHVPNSIYL
jgi:hypothetical protein